MKRVFTILAAGIALAGTLFAVTAPAAATGHRAGSSVSLANSSCHNETIQWQSPESAGTWLKLEWVSNGCGWHVWPHAHCANPKLGTDQGWKDGGHVTSLFYWSQTPDCTNGNVVIVGDVQWRHSSGTTTYTKRLFP